LALIDLAAKLNAWIIEDDYDSEFRYTRPPLPSLHSLMEGFAGWRAVVDDHGPPIDQATLAEFISSRPVRSIRISGVVAENMARVWPPFSAPPNGLGCRSCSRIPTVE
jgi:hypothetical protein